MKILKNRVILPAIFIVYGLFYFFEPVLSAWFEVVNPSIAKTIFLPIHWVTFIISMPIYLISFLAVGEENISTISYVTDFLFLLFFICYLIYYVVVIRKNWTIEQKKLALFPLFIFPIFWLALLPIGVTNIERHINSFPIGGWSRMMFAGGPKTIKEDGIKLLESTKQEYPEDEELPPSIKKLGYWVKVERDKQLLLVGIGRMFNMADEFGFIIQKENGKTPIPHYLEKSEFYRVWKIADGIYFFEQ